MVVASALVVHGPARAHQETARIARVRSGVPMINAAIARGNERSPTFRRLIETIGKRSEWTRQLRHVRNGCGSRSRAGDRTGDLLKDYEWGVPRLRAK